MSQALYRKHRSRAFSEVVGQDHIINTLEKAIKSGRISHAYLFTGPRGVGKTSVARILAHEINGLPYTDESTHLDIIEIDAASNRRIDEIRELRDKVHTSPTSAKYKVYIIDEVHMLTREAFNALLKTLEEPPAHAVFILATTEAHKLPETIISRTQRFEFKPVNLDQVAKHLNDIAKSEKIKIDQPSLKLLAEYGEGSFRDSISLLDQLGSSGQAVTEADVRQMLGLPAGEAIKDLIDFVSDGNSAQVLQTLDQLQNQGMNSAAVARLIANELRGKITAGESADWLYSLLKELIEVPASSRPYDSLEICLLQAALANASNHTTKVAPAQINPSPSIVKEKPKNVAATKVPEPEFTNFDQNAWEAVLGDIKGRAASLYTALRLATPQTQDEILVLNFQFPLHQKKVDQAVHKELIMETVERLCGQRYRIECRVDKSTPQPAKEPKPVAKAADNSTEHLSTISNIFGGAEVLES